MNIINEIKIENRAKEAPTNFSMKLARTKKNLVPLKWFALFILLVLPVFEMPNFCITSEPNYKPNYYKDQCDNHKNVNSNIPKLPP